MSQKIVIFSQMHGAPGLGFRSNTKYWAVAHAEEGEWCNVFRSPGALSRGIATAPKIRERDASVWSAMISAVPDRIHPKAEMPLSHPLINRPFIVRDFSDRVRSDARLGPILASDIRGDWEPHVEKVTDFWCSVILKTSAHRSRPALQASQISSSTGPNGSCGA